jgi:hypothetical protein
MTKRIKLYIEPVPLSATAVAILDRACSTAAPCGGKCIMSGHYRHQFHTCRNWQCPECHEPERFGRARGRA